MLIAKWWYVKRNDDGFITEATVRFYEAEINTKDETVVENGKLKAKPVTKLRITRPVDVSNRKNIKKDANGVDTVLYTQKDFGQIKTDEELRSFCDQQL